MEYSELYHLHCASTKHTSTSVSPDYMYMTRSRRMERQSGNETVGLSTSGQLKMAAALKSIARACIDSSSEELYSLSNELWTNPELCFEEHKAHALLTDFLEKKGFTVDRSYTGIETAFRATFGSGRPNVCVICEYDALPEIGHACGHNLIAEAGVAAGLGLKAALEASGAPQARVTVLGTPAEEGGGGKVYLIENGAFEDVDIAMMVHPAPYTVINPQFVAITACAVTFTGKAAHAAAFPWEGVNALDAAVLAYNNISVLRQQMKPNWSVAGIITNGGTKPNIIPNKACMEYYIRAPMREELDLLTRKVNACFHAAATATGCTVEIKGIEKPFDNLQSNQLLAKVFARNLESFEHNFVETLEEVGSTDMGNVSYVVPSIHPMYKIGTKEVYHTREFTSVTNTPESHKVTLTMAKTMAFTCIDVLTTTGMLQEIKLQFTKEVGGT